MRKLKLQVQISVDGYIAGPNGEMDWMIWNWDDELKKYVIGITDPVDCIIMGRKLAEGFIPHWKTVAENTEDPQYEFGKKMHDTPKVVFSKTPDKYSWGNTELAIGNLSEEINKLKNKDGKDLIAYGGASFVSALIKGGLIDEFHLFINPSILGNGMPIFKELTEKQNLALKKSQAFSCGIVLNCYEPSK